MYLHYSEAYIVCHYTWCIVAVHERAREEERKYRDMKGRDLDYHFNMLVSSQSVPIDLECVSVCVPLLMFLSVDWQNCIWMQTQFAVCCNGVIVLPQQTVRNWNQHQRKMMAVFSGSTTNGIYPFKCAYTFTHILHSWKLYSVFKLSPLSFK